MVTTEAVGDVEGECEVVFEAIVEAVIEGVIVVESDFKVEAVPETDTERVTMDAVADTERVESASVGETEPVELPLDIDVADKDVLSEDVCVACELGVAETEGLPDVEIEIVTVGDVEKVMVGEPDSHADTVAVCVTDSVPEGEFVVMGELVTDGVGELVMTLALALTVGE